MLAVSILLADYRLIVEMEFAPPMTWWAMLEEV
jgi:hypothetical protein